MAKDKRCKDCPALKAIEYEAPVGIIIKDSKLYLSCCRSQRQIVALGKLSERMNNG